MKNKYKLGNFIFKTKKAMKSLSHKILNESAYKQKIENMEYHLFLCDLIKRHVNFTDIMNDEIEDKGAK